MFSAGRLQIKVKKEGTISCSAVCARFGSCLIVIEYHSSFFLGRRKLRIVTEKNETEKDNAGLSHQKVMQKDSK